MHAPRKSVFTIILLLFLAACSGDSQQQGQSNPGPGVTPPFVVAVNNPLSYFTTRLLGDQVEVRLLAPAGQDPALWQPTVAEIAQLQQAELVILNGAGYSSWPDKISISSRKLVNTSAGLDEHFIALEQQTTHSHGPEGEHAHGDHAFTLWMDLSLAQTQSEEIARALQRTWPQYSENIAVNLEELLADLALLDSQYQQWASAMADRQIVFSHPVYQYFERRYQLTGTSLHWEPNQMPEQEQWEQLQALIDGDAPALLVWEGTPSKAIADRLLQLDIAWAVIDPGAAPGDVDWLALQQHNLASLERGAAQPSTSGT